MRELRILEFKKRIEIWEDNKLIAYAKKSEDDLFTFTVHHGYTSPENREQFIVNVVKSWIHGTKHINRIRDKHYAELLVEEHCEEIRR